MNIRKEVDHLHVADYRNLTDNISELHNNICATDVKCRIICIHHDGHCLIEHRNIMIIAIFPCSIKQVNFAETLFRKLKIIAYFACT